MTNPPNSTNDPWVVFDYEADMFFAMCNLLVPDNQEFASLTWHTRNAIVESALLHTRQLADILLSRGNDADDIHIEVLVPNFQPTRLNVLLQAYGNSRIEGSPCRTINKMLAHPTTLRTSNYDYGSMLSDLVPIIAEIVHEIRGQRSVQIID